MVEKKARNVDGVTPNVATTFYYNEAAIRNNFAVLEYCRTCQAAASGIVSGILGLTGAYGFIFYFLGVLFQVNLFI